MPIHEKHFWHMFLSLQMVFHFVAAATVFTALEIISILATSLLLIKTRYLNCFTTLRFSLQTFILLENPFLLFIMNFIQVFHQTDKFLYCASSTVYIVCSEGLWYCWLPWYSSRWLLIGHSRNMIKSVADRRQPWNTAIDMCNYFPMQPETVIANL